MQNRMSYSLIFIIGSLLTLTACDDKSPLEEVETAKESISVQMEDGVPAAKRLRDVVGHVNHTHFSHDDHSKEVTLSDDAKPYIGRYLIKVDCTDKIVNCEGGSADIILNLLADGTAHRTIIHLGKITYASNLQYSEDKWFFDSKTKEVVLERANGVTFFFNTDHPNQLIMNAKKVISGTEKNRKYFANGYPKPLRNYVLTKEDDK
ncbi:hypothetical protein B9T31_10725 [Acinetobacter sp. ANC 4558]|uniref:hypothetical protein n=1 Tax=Acinetobacter sp. ANC 4558 TaxID=1977876 RepID=UPI000A351909|nr:hypothetical protein [Acinetobacter sp. ANC 4558]OTG85627.1 hypothetical protein B9T31_10725 [Acinetobacter sp. ANC 4558]